MNQNFKKKIGDFQLGKTIGSGTFGKVKEGIHLPTGQKVAIKILQKNKIDNREDLQRVQQELKILQKVEHPNIIRLLQLHQTPSNIYIVTELVEGIELYQLIVQQKEQNLHQKLCGSYFYQLVDAVEFLHVNGICHRDIKPENIIIDQKNNYLKLIDFGLSKEFEQSAGFLQTSCGSPCYAAPQMLHGNKYDACKVDVWALGVTLHAMIAGRLPYQEENTERLYKIIDRKAGFVCEQDIPHQIGMLIEAMMQRQPKKRPTVSKLKQYQWIQKAQSLVPQHIYENDALILESMSNFFQIPIPKIRKILKNKQIPSICTYYFLGRRLKSQPENFKIDNVRSKDKKSNSKDKNNHKTHKNSLSAFKDLDCLNIIKKLHKFESENKNQYKQHNLKIHKGPFHLNFAFENYQQLHQYICEIQPETNVKMLQSNIIEVKGVQVEIKIIQGTELLYADFPAYFSGKLTKNKEKDDKFEEMNY